MEVLFRRSFSEFRSTVIPVVTELIAKNVHFVQYCTEVLFLSLLSEFRSTVTPVVTEMITLVQGKPMMDINFTIYITIVVLKLSHFGIEFV